ncbi:shikimate dehydrogenase [Palleronia caenipelagi]|uniref:Shikimate dehydrogenase (NADP(+)) n=1 Tax=Palleronia caenipelagi TaxID=2489174 RepID=A0A547Q8T4_9RHOB|nr:shikimate dehydrogenase [Palleronia caenipelagi]TRD22788.1 shikimate dehydrogenase [Palleronia caenipelagi]
MTTSIPLAAVLGDPIAHSRSPALHGHWLAKYGVKGHYVPICVSQADLAEFLEMMPRMGFVGCNVTVPHKEAVIDLSHSVSDRAALIGAANTLVFREDGTIHADNTDGYGFIENLRQNAPDWVPTDGPVAVLGAGGAARAVLVSLLDAGATEIRLANRTRSRAEALRREFGSRIIVHDWVQAGAMLSGAATLVNTTTQGMVGKSVLNIPLDKLPSNALVTDLVYNPLETDLLYRARQKGCRTVDGLGMLLHQAVPGFERWFGVRPDVDDALRDAVLAG